jgi:NADH:ubiquinone oxidoreductase subunit 6 (subunit J)
LGHRLCGRGWARYIKPMEFLFILLIVAMLGTVGILLLGVLNMAKGGNPRRSNKLMQMRVWLQGAALLIFIILALAYGHH